MGKFGYIVCRFSEATWKSSLVDNSTTSSVKVATVVSFISSISVVKLERVVAQVHCLEEPLIIG